MYMVCLLLCNIMALIFIRRKEGGLQKVRKTEKAASFLWLQLISFQSELEPCLHSLCLLFNT